LGIGFGHRRLAIIDLSPEGRQPMHSASGRFTIIFNGEIYNYQLLRKELQLKGYPFRGHSDTEVILAASEHWGIAQTVQRLNGMCAFALWDHQERQLHLVRDRLGVKPLYYGWTEAGLVFGSELRVFTRLNEVPLTLDREATTLFFRFGYIPAPWSAYQGVYKLQAGAYLTLKYMECIHRPEDFHPDYRDKETPFKPIQYWSVDNAFAQGIAQTRADSPDTLREVSLLLNDCVASRMISDVPVGAFLSGGLDSSLVTALMQKQSSSAVRTFSVGFDDPSFDESTQAALIAKHLGTAHTELRVNGADALAVVPQLAEMFDEPFADSSQIPTYLMARLTRKHVTVALSGDGGDELFAGYTRYQFYTQARRLHRIPHFLRFYLAKMLDSSLPVTAALEKLLTLLPASYQFSNKKDKIEKLRRLLMFSPHSSLYLQMHSHWLKPSKVVRGAKEPELRSWHIPSHVQTRPQLEQLMYLDLVNYLPDDVMVKVDRATMAASIEAREPLLDYRLVEMSAQLPLQMKLRDGKTKWILRKILSEHVPPALFEKPKSGFGVPLASWLRGPLKEWAHDLLSDSALHSHEIIDAELVQTVWKNFLNGQSGEQNLLWDVLMFQSWQRRWKPQ
jgi:asparagine synthase (glutamine-hydrolysing)